MFGVSRVPPTFIRRQIDALRAYGIEVTCFPEFRRFGRVNRFVARKGLSWFLSGSMRRALRSADIFHYQWPGHLFYYYPFAKKYEKPVVLSLRGRQITIVPHLPGFEQFAAKLRSQLTLCDALHCVSEDILREAMGYGLRAERAWVIRPAVDTDFFVPPSSRSTSGPIRIAMVGALIWRKGYEYALQALQRLVGSGHRVVMTIVGEGPERDRLQYTVSDLGLSKSINLLGRVSPEDVRTVLQQSHIFLHTSLSEGIANVVLEAMACGLPVVTSDAGGLREVIQDQVDGFIVPLRDIDVTVERLAILAQTKSLRIRMGNRARMKAVRQFDLRHQGEQFVEMYRAILEC